MNLKPLEVVTLTGLSAVMIRLIQPVCLVTKYMYNAKKKCFTVGVAYKAFFSLYSVIVDCLGEGSSEKNCC